MTGVLIILTGCKPNSERTVEVLANDGEVIIEALELSKSRLGTYPNQLPEFAVSKLKQSKPSDWNYVLHHEQAYLLSTELQDVGRIQFTPIADQGKMSGWYLEEGSNPARFFRSPKIKESKVLRLENGRVGTQKAIPTH